MYVQVWVSAFCVYLLNWTVVGENGCEIDQACSATYVNSGFQLVGCPTVLSEVWPKSMVSLNCLNDIQCKAIVCNSSLSVCSTCTGDRISALTFNSSETTYFKRKFFKLNMGYDPVTLSIATIIVLPDALTPGDLVYVRATVLKFDSFLMDFLVDDNNTNFHFRTRCNDVCSDQFTCTASMCDQDKYMKLMDKVNGTWSSVIINDQNYPFNLNQQFELHFLVMSKSIACYIDRKYYRTYNTPYNAQSVYGIRVRGTVSVHEFSV